MKKNKLSELRSRVEDESRSALDEILREGARQMLQLAIEAEVADYIENHKEVLDESGHRLVVRNGHLPARVLQSGAGPIPLQQPRIHDRREGEKFSSSILPPYMRRSPSVEDLIPLLYLKGVSTNAFGEALVSILGPHAIGLSPSTISRLKEVWEEEYFEWKDRDLSSKRYVYFWADGIYFNVRLNSDRPCLLVIIGTLEDGTKELVAIHDGERESKLSWLETMRDLKRHGLQEAPLLAVGDGALGFWSALEEVFPATREQRCWVHKTANILDKMPKKIQPGAKEKIFEMYMASTKKEALEAFEEFIALYEAKYPKAVECLAKDKNVLFTFYDFPAEHWIHIRTSNPIESTFATVRHRHRQTKGCGSRTATLSMVFKLACSAEKRWRKINSYKMLGKLIKGVRFIDGIEAQAA